MKCMVCGSETSITIEFLGIEAAFCGTHMPETPREECRVIVVSR